MQYIGAGKRVAVVPSDIRTDMQGVFRGAFVHIPMGQQHATQRAVALVFHQIFQPSPCDIGDLGPVGSSGVFGGADLLLDAQCAALTAGRFWFRLHPCDS